MIIGATISPKPDQLPTWVRVAARKLRRRAPKIVFVTNNLDTLLTALYVDLTDRVLPALGWTRDHPQPALDDAELL
jgi:hypothetical protein